MPLSRRLVLALPPLVPLVVGACSSPEPVLYTLPMKPGPVLNGGPKIVQLRDITIPAYLDRREIVRSSASYKLGVSSNNWWAEPLAGLLSRTIVVGLAQRLPGSNVYAEGGSVSVDANAILGVNVQRLDADAAGTVELMAQAGVEFYRPRRQTARTFTIAKTPSSANVEGQVAAIADAVAELTDGLAQMLVS
ncbi:MAG: membrane integrity-associated transporter subunit PqiC [Alphaproteobacteria bacterium]|nr:membrane integrity-associated transporter subunit PqiC [Alphaproteobacteria bacterium]